MLARQECSERKTRSWRGLDPFIDDLGEITVLAIRFHETLLEGLPAQGQQLDVVDRAYGRCPSRLGEDPDLAEGLPPPKSCELDHVALGGAAADLDLPLSHDVEALREVAFRQDHFTGGE